MVRSLVLPGQDPWTNLALEEALFDALPAGGMTLVQYVNRPCVVIGKHQNPLREVQFDALRERRLPLLRRFSGGGTVWHDTGNLNWSFLCDKSRYDKETLLRIVAESLLPLGIRLEVTPQGDLLLGDKKVAGTASQLRRERALLHGTLLCDADLGALRGVLGPTGSLETWVGVSSRPRSVVNLGVSVGAAADSLAKRFHEVFGGGPESPDLPPPDAHRATLRSKPWVWDRTPPFTWNGPTRQGNLRAKVEDGKILEASLSESDDETRILSRMAGMDFFSSEFFDLFDEEAV